MVILKGLTQDEAKAKKPSQVGKAECYDTEQEKVKAREEYGKVQSIHPNTVYVLANFYPETNYGGIPYEISGDQGCSVDYGSSNLGDGKSYGRSWRVYCVVPQAIYYSYDYIDPVLRTYTDQSDLGVLNNNYRSWRTCRSVSC